MSDPTLPRDEGWDQDPDDIPEPDIEHDERGVPEDADQDDEDS